MRVAQKSISILITIAIVLAFVDESIRKAIPSNPILVTAIKDIFIYSTFLIIFIKYGRDYNKYLIIFIPWFIYISLSVSYVYIIDGSLLHFVATFKTYFGIVASFLVGIYLSKQLKLFKKIKIIFIIGFTLAIAVGLLQEYYREYLPVFLSYRVYLDKHSLAGGNYVDSLFVSPTTFSIVCSVVLIYIFYILIHNYKKNDKKRIYLYYMYIFLALTGILISRMRAILFLLVIVSALILYISTRTNNKNRQVIANIGIHFVIILSISLPLLILLSGNSFEPNNSLEKDIEFYGYLLNQEELLRRFTIVFSNFSFTDSNFLWGYGAGTCGRLLSFLNEENNIGNFVTDSGISLLFNEFGLLGTIVFLLPILHYMSIATFRIFQYKRYERELVPAWGVTILLVFYFLFKSNNVLLNSFMQNIWFLSLGVMTGNMTKKVLKERTIIGNSKFKRLVIMKGYGKSKVFPLKSS